MKFSRIFTLTVVVLIGFINPAFLMAKTEEELAKQLQNPVAALISVPFQFNYDSNIGADDDGGRMTLNIQPVVPVDISQDWNLISRTILPVVYQDDIFAGAGSQFGIGDIVQSVFFSPKAPTKNGWIWGAGPVFLLPTGSDDLLTTDKWGVGPTAVALNQRGPWTYGALVNHIVSFAGDDNRDDVNATFLQPFCSYTTATALSIGVNTESTYDWENEKWSIPINVFISTVTSISGQTMSFSGGLRYWLESPDSGPEGWGFRAVIVFLFPK